MLLDSNIIIYSVDPSNFILHEFIASQRPAVSAISYVEVLGYHGLSGPDRQSFQRFFASALVLPIDNAVIDRAVSLRRQRRMSLGDALIGATALVHGRTLVTRNTEDFRWITGLQLLDPLASAPPAGE